MQDIRNYIVITITLTSIIVFFYVLFLTKRERDLEKKFNCFALSTTKKSNNVLDFIASILVKILKFFSKTTTKIKLANKLSKRYEKYILLSSSMITAIDIMTLKNIFFISCFLLTFIFEYLSIISITYISVFIISIFAFLIPDIILVIKYQNRRKNISLEIVDAIILINNNLKKGLNIINAIEEVNKEVSDILKVLLNKIKLDLESGMDLALSFQNFSDILCLSSSTYISKTMNELKTLNININETFLYLARKLKEKKKKEEKIVIHLSSLRLIYKLTISIPLIIVFFLIIAKPSYFEIVFSSLPAIFLLTSLLLIYISYIIVIGRLIKRGEVYE